VRKPGDWEPCPGATTTSTLVAFRGRGPGGAVGLANLTPSDL
jgi:hypothetical protein